MKILIVDDSLILRSQLSEVLIKAGFEVVEAGSGDEGIARRKETPDIAFMIVDFNMPGMSGIDMLEQMKGPLGMSSVPVFMLTTESNPTLREKARGLGVAAWAVKPFVPDTLIQAIRKVLERPAKK